MNITRRDALKTIAALPLAGGLTANIAPAAECDCGCDIPAMLDCTISDCGNCLPDYFYFTLTNPDGTKVCYEWDGEWWKPVGDELPERFPRGFRYGDDLNIEEMEPGYGIIRPCCGE